MMLQQGDVLFKKIDKIPKDAKKINGNVLVEGEYTGHAHRVKAAISAYVIISYMNKLYLNALEDCEVTHEEHHTQTIPKGMYLIERVKEYDHFSEEIREVAD